MSSSSGFSSVNERSSDSPRITVGSSRYLAHAIAPELRIPRVAFAAEHRTDKILSKRMRKQLRRSTNKIHTDSLEITIGFDRGRAITSELIDEVEAVHVSRDRATRRQSDLDRRAERDFWRNACEGGIDGQWEVEIATLRLDGNLAVYVAENRARIVVTSGSQFTSIPKRRASEFELEGAHG